MVKCVPLILLLGFLPFAAFAEYDDPSRAIPLESFKDRFTFGELLDISSAYGEDPYIRTTVSKLEHMAVVDLDSDVIKNAISYLTSKSILSEHRARDILR